MEVFVKERNGYQKTAQFIIFGEDNTVILKKIEKPAMQKTFDEIAKPLQKAAKKAGLTKRDLTKAITKGCTRNENRKI